MTPEVAQVLETARSMTQEQRADLAYQLLLTLDDTSADQAADVVSEWRREIESRLDDYLSGHHDVVDVRASHASIRDQLTSQQRL